MAIDDELEKSAIAAEIREEAERSVQEILVRSGVAGAISLIPYGVGSAINEMLTQLALRRTHARMEEMFDQMAQHIRDLGEEKIDREWFRGEEFQTLIFEALHQLHVTQDKNKIEMLGKGLANSGATEFRDESRKQLFMQLVRDLTPQHIACLHGLMPQRPKSATAEEHPDWFLWRNRPQINATGSDLLIMQMLAANGLVEESLKTVAAREPHVRALRSQTDIERAVKDFLKELQKPPLRFFSLSKLGSDFLNFVGSKPEKEDDSQAVV